MGGEIVENLVVFSEDGVELEVSVTPEQDTVWLTQAQMAKLFDTTSQNITLHIGNLYRENELSMDATCKEFLQVKVERRRNVTRKQKQYNLDVIISVGYH